MGVLRMAIGTLIFIIALVIFMQPIITILDGTKDIRTTAQHTVMYGTDSNGQVVAVGYADAGGDLTEFLLYGIGFFATIGFVIWLVMRAPNEPDWGNPYDQNGGNRF